MPRGRPPGPDVKKALLITKILIETKEWIWVRELARKCKMPLSTVHYYLEKHLNRFFDEINTSQFISYEDGEKYPKLRLLKIKDGVSLQNVVKWLKIKEKI